MQSVGAVFHQACARSRKTGSGTRTKRQPSGSKANASESGLIWHRVIPGPNDLGFTEIDYLKSKSAIADLVGANPESIATRLAGKSPTVLLVL